MANQTIAARILTTARGALLGIAVFSLVINALMLTGPIYMLQIYDRVLGSGSIATLVALSIIVLALYAAMAVIDLIRQNILIRIGHKFDDRWARPPFTPTSTRR